MCEALPPTLKKKDKDWTSGAANRYYFSEHRGNNTSTAVKRTWFLDKGRQFPQLAVQREQFPFVHRVLFLIKYDDKLYIYTLLRSIFGIYSRWVQAISDSYSYSGSGRDRFVSRVLTNKEVALSPISAVRDRNWSGILRRVEKRKRIQT